MNLFKLVFKRIYSQLTNATTSTRSMPGIFRNLSWVYAFYHYFFEEQGSLSWSPRNKSKYKLNKLQMSQTVQAWHPIGWHSKLSADEKFGPCRRPFSVLTVQSRLQRSKQTQIDKYKQNNFQLEDRMSNWARRLIRRTDCDSYQYKGSCSSQIFWEFYWITLNIQIFEIRLLKNLRRF